MKKLVIAAGGIVVVIVAGFFLYRHFVINSIMDGPFMENTSPAESEPESASARETDSVQETESAREPESIMIPSERALPETADLVEFSWHQSAMNHDDCFDFWMKTTEQAPEVPYLYCSYTDPETRERIELGDEMFIYRAGRQKSGGESEAKTEAGAGFQAEADAKSEDESGGKPESEIESSSTAETKDPRCPIIPYERWQELADFLRKAELSPYQTQDPGLLDGTDSKLELTWSANGQQITETFDGRSADGLLALLQNIIRGI